MEKQLEGLDLNLLLTLHWLLAERNVTAAAGKLGLSQPATSRALARLRGVFGDPLLVKVGGEMAPTPLAMRLQPELMHAMEKCRSVLRVSGKFVPVQQSGRFRLACSDHIGILMASVWERSVRDVASNFELDLLTPTLETARDLITGKVDVCVVPGSVVLNLPPSVDPDAYVQRPILEQDFLCAIRADHPLAGKPIGLEEYLSLDHVLITPEGLSRGVVDTVLSEMGRERRILYRAQSFLMGVPLIQYTDCVITGPRQMIQHQAESLYVFEPPLSLNSSALYAVWHPNWTHDPRHSWVRGQLFSGISALSLRSSALNKNSKIYGLHE